jgi:hypothetical protein
MLMIQPLSDCSLSKRMSSKYPVFQSGLIVNVAFFGENASANGFRWDAAVAYDIDLGHQVLLGERDARPGE